MSHSSEANAIWDQTFWMPCFVQMAEQAGRTHLQGVVVVPRVEPMTLCWQQKCPGYSRYVFHKHLVGINTFYLSSCLPFVVFFLVCLNRAVHLVECTITLCFPSQCSDSEKQQFVGLLRNEHYFFYTKPVVSIRALTAKMHKRYSMICLVNRWLEISVMFMSLISKMYSCDSTHNRLYFTAISSNLCGPLQQAQEDVDRWKCSLWQGSKTLQARVQEMKGGTFKPIQPQKLT